MSLYPLFGKFRFPNLMHAEKHTFNFSGTLLTISAPPFSSKWGKEQIIRENINIFDKQLFLDIKNSNVLSLLCFKTDWTIKGAPLCSGKIGNIYFSISILFWENDIDLFNCRSFEHELIERYKNDYSDNGRFSSDSFEGLIDWKAETINGHEWISYSSQTNGLNNFTDYLWRTPLSNKHMLTLNFGTRVRNEDPTVRNEIVRFCRNITQTVTISPSDDLSDLRKKSVENFPSQSYSKSMETLRWIRPQEMSFDEFLNE